MYNEEKTGVLMVSRAMAILNYLSGKDKAVGISEIAKDMGLPKATVFRILNSLEEWDAVECGDGSGYRLGCFLIKLGKSAGKDAHLIDVCKPHMEQIAKEVGENLNLAIEYENAMLSIYSTNIASLVLSPKSIPISPLYFLSIRYTHLPDSLRSSWVNPLAFPQPLFSIAEVSSLLERFHAM